MNEIKVGDIVEVFSLVINSEQDKEYNIYEIVEVEYINNSKNTGGVQLYYFVGKESPLTKEEIRKLDDTGERSVEESERLKNIQYNWNKTDWGIDKSDINWLIEQAEKVEKLETNAKDLREALGERQEQVKQYEEALEFYADENTHKLRNATDSDDIYDPFTLIEIDKGEQARKALENK